MAYSETPTERNAVNIIHQPTKLDEAIDAATAELATLKTTEPDYEKTLAKVKELYALKEKNSPKRVSPDTLAVVLGNLVGIIWITNHERIHVITSKALGFVLKPSR